MYLLSGFVANMFNFKLQVKHQIGSFVIINQLAMKIFEKQQNQMNKFYIFSDSIFLIRPDQCCRMQYVKETSSYWSLSTPNKLLYERSRTASLLCKIFTTLASKVSRTTNSRLQTQTLACLNLVSECCQCQAKDINLNYTKSFP